MPVCVRRAVWPDADVQRNRLGLWGGSKRSSASCLPRRSARSLPATQIDFRPPSPENMLKLQWSVQLPVVARAMVRTGGTIWVAGLPAQGKSIPGDAAVAVRPRRAGRVFGCGRSGPR